MKNLTRIRELAEKKNMTRIRKLTNNTPYRIKACHNALIEYKLIETNES